MKVHWLRIVIVGGSGAVTLDALDWMGEQGIALIRLTWDGHIVSVLGQEGHAADLEKVRWQMDTRNCPQARRDFALSRLRAKTDAALETLASFMPASLFADRARAGIERSLASLNTTPPVTIADVLGLEGAIAADYFRAWQGLTVRWTASQRPPIPEEWRTFVSRSAVRAAQRIGNRNATHPVNAMLNYAYGYGLAQTRMTLIAQGFDPNLGIVHDTRQRDRGRTPAFALDEMEPLRPVIDRAVLAIVREETFSAADFILRSDGTVRLNPALATHTVATTARVLAGPMKGRAPAEQVNATAQG